MSALDTRAYLARHQDWYLSPLPLTGATAEAMDAWITVGVTKGEAGELTQIWRTNDRGHEVLAAEGYELERTCCAPVDDMTWSERVLVVRSPIHATHQAAGLETRLRHAETGGVSNVDIDGNNTLEIKAIGVVISTFETRPKKAYWTPKFRHLGVDQQYPPVFVAPRLPTG